MQDVEDENEKRVEREKAREEESQKSLPFAMATMKKNNPKVDHNQVGFPIMADASAQVVGAIVVEGEGIGINTTNFMF